VEKGMEQAAVEEEDVELAKRKWLQHIIREST
jgi:hypothetical protein